MGAIPQQLMARLPVESVRTRARVSSIDEQVAILEGGERITARLMVLATDGAEAARLLNAPKQPSFRGTTCLYFAAKEAPIDEPILILNGEHVGPINSIVIPSNVSAAYAPVDQALITVNVLGIPRPNDKDLTAAVRAQLEQWFGHDVKNWEHLRTYRIHNALPLQTPSVDYPGAWHMRLRPWLFVCGDYHNAASTQWAMFSGTRAGQEVVEALQS